MARYTKATWEAADDGEAMLFAAERARVERRVLARAACEVAAVALRRVTPVDPDVAAVLAAIEAWAHGTGPEAAIARGRAGLSYNRLSGIAVGSAVNAAYAAADAAYTDAETTANAVTNAVTYAALDAAAWRPSLRPSLRAAVHREVGRTLATIVRKHVPWALMARPDA